MIKVGITGGIGSGKSTISKVLASMGYPVYIADAKAKELMHTDSQLISELKELFGEDIYHEEKLNRVKLAQLVFSNKEKLAQLNALVHPAVKRDFENWCSKQKSHIMFEEAAILFETGSYTFFDKTIVVAATEEERIKRVMLRDKCSREDVLNRMKNQWPQEKKVALADFVINNEGDELVIPQVLGVLGELKKC